MNDSPQTFETSPVSNRFARLAARFSVLAPLVSTLVFVLIGFLGVTAHVKLALFERMVMGLIAVLLILIGFVSGIIALALPKGDRRKGILIQAIVGLCLNCLILLLMFLPLMLLPHAMITPQGWLKEATNELAKAQNEEEKFYALDGAAKESFAVGNIGDARIYANELLQLAPKYPSNWNYGNAIQDGNLVLGRIAVRDGKIEEAKNYLLEAGKGPGSPQMDSFGPNMSLAKDLLEKGQRDVVLQYFTLCRKFWTIDNGKLDEWSGEVKAGQTPDFGANLVY